MGKKKGEKKKEKRAEEPKRKNADISIDTPSDEEMADLADLFKVFADSTRIRILFALLDAEISVGELASLLDMTQSAISHQLKTLKQSKLVGARREGKSIIYFLLDDHVRTIIAQGLDHVLE